MAQDLSPKGDVIKQLLGQTSEVEGKQSGVPQHTGNPDHEDQS